jgi:O-antigen ligase
LVFGVPLFFLRNVNDPINIPKLALLAAGLALAAGLRIAGILSGTPWTGLKRLWLPAAAILLPLVVAWVFSEYPGWSLMGQYPRYLGLIPYALTILLGVLVADAFGRDTRPVAWALSAAGALAGAYALIQVADLDPLGWAARGVEVRAATSTLGNTNFTGGFLALVIPIVLSLWFMEPERRVAVGTCAVLILAGLAASRSQGGYAAAVTGLLLTGAFLLTGPKRVLLLLGAGIAAAGVAAVVVVGMVRPESVPGTIELRGRWWQAAAEATMESPLVGRGPSAFALEHSQHRTVQDVAATGSVVEADPHSVPLSFAAGAGVLGLAGFAFALFWLLRAGYRAASASLAAAGFLGGVGAYVAQALVSIDTVALRSSFWAIGGALAAAAAPEAIATTKAKNLGKGTRRSRAPAPASSAALFGVPLVVIAGLLGAGWGVRLVIADTRYQDAIARGGGNYGTVRSDYERALASRNEVAYRAGYASFLADVALQVSEQGGEAEANSLIHEASEAFSFTMGLPDVRWATAHARTRRDWAVTHPDVSPDVIELYHRALALDPANYLLYEEAAEAALELGEQQSAERFEERAASLRAQAGT